MNDVEHPSRPHRFEHRCAIDIAVPSKSSTNLSTCASLMSTTKSTLRSARRAEDDARSRWPPPSRSCVAGIRHSPSCRHDSPSTTPYSGDRPRPWPYRSHAGAWQRARIVRRGCPEATCPRDLHRAKRDYRCRTASGRVTLRRVRRPRTAVPPPSPWRLRSRRVPRARTPARSRVPARGLRRSATRGGR